MRASAVVKVLSQHPQRAGFYCRTSRVTRRSEGPTSVATPPGLGASEPARGRAARAHLPRKRTALSSCPSQPGACRPWHDRRKSRGAERKHAPACGPDSVPRRRSMRWRRGRDSNPRGFWPTRFPIVRTRPTMRPLHKSPHYNMRQGIASNQAPACFC